MSNDTIEAAVAEATGEDIETIRELGFYLVIRLDQKPASELGQCPMTDVQ